MMGKYSARSLLVISYVISICFVGCTNVPFSVEIASSPEEVNKYIHFYSETPSSLERFKNDSSRLFLLAKGAKIITYGVGNMYQRDLDLRHIVSIEELDVDSTYQYQLVVEDNTNGEPSQVAVTAKLGYASNSWSIQSTILHAEIIKSSKTPCDELSRESNCTKCMLTGRCEKGHVSLDPWLKFALKTQRHIQIDKNFLDLKFLGAHNAFNDRADFYGVFDDCKWPPPYKPLWICLANQEFAMSDLLDLGVHSLELDPWWCIDKLTLSHAKDKGLGCSPTDRAFSNGVREIGNWVKKPENKGEIIRLYLEDGADHTKGHDDLINGIIEKYLGEFVFTPADMKAFHGRWPSARELKKMGKTVILATDGSYTHGGKYIHNTFWQEWGAIEFTPYPDCGGKPRSVVRRFFCDSTHYGPFWNGPAETGVILDFTEYMKCGIEYSDADQANTVMLKTAVFTWAEGEPSEELKKSSCVYIKASSGRWHVATNCTVSMHRACSNETNKDQWIMSKTMGPYKEDNTQCPEGFHFDVPTDGYQQQKLREVLKQDVWINLTPYLPLLMGETIF